MITEQQQLLVEQFNKFYTIFDNVLSYLNLDSISHDYYLKRKQWIERLAQIEFPVAFLGTYSAGKSTTINAIIGDDILPESTQATTAFPTIIRKGAPERCTVYFLDENGKYQLMNLLIDEFMNILQFNDEERRLVKEGSHDKQRCLEFLSIRAKEFQQKSGIRINSEPFKKLKRLFTEWDDINSFEKDIPISEIKNYIEDNSESLFIDRMEVILPSIALPEDVILVDLPGLGVANQRHVKITEEYVKEKAKAFVVCNAPKQLLEGEQIDLLDRLNRQNQTILHRSFWIINQMDSVVTEDKNRTIKEFYEKVKHRNFEIEPTKIFKVSARRYAVLTHIYNETIDQTLCLKNYILGDQLLEGVSAQEAGELLKSNDEVVEFGKFKEALFSYINKDAKDEFLANARGQLYQVVDKLIDILIPLDRQYKPDTNYDNILFSAALDKFLIPFIEKLESIINKYVQQIRKRQNLALLTTEHQSELVKCIKKILTKDDDLINQLRQGMDVHGNLMSRLPHILNDRFIKNDYFRKQIVEVARKPFIDDFLNTLHSELIQENINFLPEDIRSIFKDYLSERDITMRLHGLSDGVLHEYIKELDRIGRSIPITNSDEDDLDNALKYYQDNMEKSGNSTREELNQKIWLTLKNHAEYINIKLFDALCHKRESIKSHIAAAKGGNLFEDVDKEKQKRSIIMKSYTSLVKLRDDLQNSGKISLIMNDKNE